MHNNIIFQGYTCLRKQREDGLQSPHSTASVHRRGETILQMKGENIKNKRGALQGLMLIRGQEEKSFPYSILPT